MPESRGRKRKKGGRRGPGSAARQARRTGPSLRTRRDDLPPIDGIVRTIVRGGRELLAFEDPFEAEMWASQVLGLTYKQPLPLDVRGRFEALVWDGVLEQAEAEGSPASLAALRALAAVAEEPLAAQATEAADRIAAAGGVPEPRWASEIGTPAAFVRGWTLTDPYRDQVGYFAHFRYPGRDEHLISAVYDENLGGIVKDASAGVLASDPRATAEGDPDAEVADVDPGTLAAAVRSAIASGDLYLDNEWTEDFKALRALLLARMRLLPEDEAVSVGPPDDTAREALVDEFLATPGAPPDDDVTRGVLDHCLTARCDFGDGDPLRWSPTVVEMFLLDFLPRKATIDAAQIRAMPTVLKAWVAFCLERRGLERRWIEETQAAVDEFIPEFHQAVTDPSSFGPAKAITNAMLAEGIDLTDPEAVQSWIDALRPAVRRARRVPRGPYTGPATRGPAGALILSERFGLGLRAAALSACHSDDLLPSCLEMAYPQVMARPPALPVRLGPQGRLVVPVELRRELGLDEGTELAIRSDGRRLILEPRSEVLRRLRRRFANVDTSLAEELASDRRDEARRESER